MLAPVRERYAELRGDEQRLEAILAEGAEKARAMARETLADVREAMGVGPPRLASARVRRLALLVGAIVLVDTMFYAAITPLLPDLADELRPGQERRRRAGRLLRGRHAHRRAAGRLAGRARRRQGDGARSA